jgi:hypothetical protein
MKAPEASLTVPEMLPTGEADNKPAQNRQRTVAMTTDMDVVFLIVLTLRVDPSAFKRGYQPGA